MSLFTGMASELKCFFADSMEYFSPTTTNNRDGHTDTEFSAGEIPCAFYEGSSAKTFISDKFKAEVDAVAVHAPEDFNFSIQDNYRATLKNKGRNFTVVHADDVGLQGGGVVVGLKEDRVTNGI